jgi:phosphate transport system permease protein
MQTIEGVTVEGRGIPARSVARARRRVADVAARWVVSAGGLATIAGIAGIFVFICIEMSPLWRAPTAAAVSAFRLPTAGRLFAPATEEYREIMEVVTDTGVVRFLSLRDGSVIEEMPIATLAGKQVTAAARAGKDHVLLATNDGVLVGVRLRFDVKREGGKRQLRPRVADTGAWTLSPNGRAARLVAASVPGDNGITAAYAYDEAAPELVVVREERNVFGAVKRSESRHVLALPSGGSPTSLLVTGDGRRVFVGASNGFLHYFDVENPEQPLRIDSVAATSHLSVPITTLALLIGDQSVVVGDGEGKVSVWFPVRDGGREAGWRLQRVHELAAHPAAVGAIAPSPRDKRFVTADTAGHVALHHATTAQTQVTLPALQEPVAAVAFSPKANGGLTIGTGGAVVNWESTNPHPEVSLRSLFGKVWYEGYEGPAYVWQSTGGTDDFEPKLSLIPLIIGTMKGTLYALLFAVPIAVLGAVYTSQFVHPSVRNLVKPTVEIMAALPSVVLGFLAGLWLAPVMEGIVPAVLAMLVVIPSMIFAAGVSWSQLPLRIRSRLRPGMEIVLLAPLVLLGMALCLWLNDGVEQVLFGGNFREWLFASAGLRYDQRNCLVVGFAMGFAVIPIIFTISEDALSNVPQRLISGSLALGATRWQTAMRVVFPTASPGIFSATMIGFGRAVGETMIVLMATGNTPVLDWNIFTGMRTLSASIAVEIPEAPHGSTLYRVLFLAALLLFIATFIINTAAELVRQRLRQRYQRL